MTLSSVLWASNQWKSEELEDLCAAKIRALDMWVNLN